MYPEEVKQVLSYVLALLPGQGTLFPLQPGCSFGQSHQCSNISSQCCWPFAVSRPQRYTVHTSAAPGLPAVFSAESAGWQLSPDSNLSVSFSSCLYPCTLSASIRPRPTFILSIQGNSKEKYAEHPGSVDNGHRGAGLHGQVVEREALGEPCHFHLSGNTT